MTARTIARLQRAIDAAVIAMDSYVPQGILFGAWVLILVLGIQALPWIFPAMFA